MKYFLFATSLLITSVAFSRMSFDDMRSNLETRYLNQTEINFEIVDTFQASGTNVQFEFNEPVNRIVVNYIDNIDGVTFSAYVSALTAANEANEQFAEAFLYSPSQTLNCSAYFKAGELFKLTNCEVYRN